MSLIHPTAIVDAAAELAATVSVGPYAVIGASVDGETAVEAELMCTMRKIV